MKLIPTGATPPNIPQTVNTGYLSDSGKAAREKVISMISAPPGQQHQETPVQNPSRVAPEELRAIHKPDSYVGNEATQSTQDTSIQEARSEDSPESIERSRQMALLARKERAIRAKQQQLETAIKTREDAIKEREQAITAKNKEYEAGYISRDRIKADPLSILAEAGVSYDDLTQQILSQQQTDPRVLNTISKLEQEIRSLREANEENKKSQVEQQDSQYKAAVKQITNDVKTLVTRDPSYEMVRATGSVRDVVELIEKTWQEDGVMLSVQDATEQVENYLLDEALKLSKLQKIQSKLTPKVATPAVENTQKQPPKQQQPQIKTLTNNMTSSRKLSAKERALLAFKGELT